MLNSVNHSYTIFSPASVSNGSLFSVRSELAGGPGGVGGPGGPTCASASMSPTKSPRPKLGIRLCRG